jgi:superfamily II DNA or RNA helicase
MRSLGYLLGLHTLTEKDGLSFYRWVRHYGCEQDKTFGGFRWNVGKDEQKVVMARLNAEIIPSKGVRLRCEEIPGFPQLDVSAELYTIENPKECDEAYAELRDALNRHDVTRAIDKDPELALTKILRARQKVELLKTPVLIELAKDYMEKGFVVPIFVNFSDTVKLLAEKLRFPVIDGSVTGEKRMKIIEALKRDEYRGVIVNSAAGGVSVDLHDVRGEFPRMGLVMPHPSAVVMIQVLGRLRRDGGKSVAHYRIILADKTIETKVFRSFNAAKDNISALNDGDLSPF